MPISKNFEIIVKTAISLEDSILKVILKSVLLKNYDDKMLKSLEKIDSRTSEDRFLTCEFDEKYVYILKNYYTTQKLCQKLPETQPNIDRNKIPQLFHLSIITGMLEGSLDLLSTVYELDNQAIKKGSYGQVKKLTLDNDQLIAIKKSIS